MELKKLATWLKVILIGVGACGVAFLGVAAPMCGAYFRTNYPELAWGFWPWLAFLWASGVPCFAVLGIAWKIVSNIEKNQSFSLENARLFRWISRLAAGDAGFFFVGNLALLLLNISHPSVVLASLVVDFIGVAVAVAAAALAYLVGKAADLQEQSDYTI